MALLIWLPLTGDLRNQGLLDCTPTQTNGGWDTDGKLGKAFNSGEIGWVNLNTNITLNEKFSFACWVKVNVRKSWGRVFSLYVSGNEYIGLCNNDASDATAKLGFHIYNEIDGAKKPDVDFYPFTITVGEWSHIAVTIDGTTVKYYMNGALVTTYTMQRTVSMTYTVNQLGTYNTVSSRANDSINDFRIYSHCLSPKEVKLISQGMILHYPLSREGFGADNIIAGTWANEVQYTYPSTSFTDKFQNTTTIVPSATQYTLSFYAKSTVDGDLIRTHFYYPNTTTKCVNNQGRSNTAADGQMDFILSTKWERYWVVYTQTETTTTKRLICPRMFSQAYNSSISGTGTVSIKCIKLEEGNKPTPWVPNSADNLYSATGLDEGIVYDVSGFNNNGTLYTTDGTGSFIYTSDTPRYSTALNIHSVNSNSTQNTSAGVAYVLGDVALSAPTQLSITFWAIIRAQGWGGGNGQGWFCTTANDRGSDYLASAMNQYDSGVSVNSSDGTTIRVGVNPTVNEWHHYAFTYDGQYARFYKDGTLFNTNNFSEPKTLAGFTKLMIGLSVAGGVWRRNNNTYSDFRIYSTCLSASDIQQLYNTPISLSSNGTLFANEFSEV